MTVTEDQIRAALDHRIRAAGLDDPSRIPAPRRHDPAPSAPAPAPAPAPHRGRRLALAVAAVLVVAAGLVAVLRPDHREAAPAGDPTTSTTSDPASGRRPELPPPWPRLDVRSATTNGSTATSDEEFLEQLPELDQQSKDELAATGRVNVLDDLTGDLVNVPIDAFDQQAMEAMRWYTEHIAPAEGSGSAITVAEMDPVLVFTDGSHRFVYRSDLDCAPDADGDVAPICRRIDQPVAEPLGTLGFSTRLDLLPDGLSVADEAETGGSPGRPVRVVLSLSLDGSRVMDGAGPYLRFTAGMDPDGASNILTRIAQGSQQVAIQGGIGVVIVDDQTDPGNVDLPDGADRPADAWVSVVWLDEDGRSLAVQGRGISTEALIRIADGTSFTA